MPGNPLKIQESLICFATQVEHLIDNRRRFTLAPDEFVLINPNTRTCPIFRSERDAELTKKLYRAAPVLVKEAITDESGQVVQPEVNPWGISFSQGLFNMTSDSCLFHDTPAKAGQPPRLPLYEAKMIHQFDHRWATYLDAASGAAGEVETADVSAVQKADPACSVRPRYWVDEREVLGRIARVPARVSRAWLALHAAKVAAQPGAVDAAESDLLLALAQWVAGDLFHRDAGAPPTPAGWTPTRAQRHIAPTEAQLKARFPRLGDRLRGEGLTTKKALAEFPKWALQNADVRLVDEELSALPDALRSSPSEDAVLALLDDWMVRRSPRWLMGWRRNARSTDERTTIAGVMPRSAQGDSVFLFEFSTSATSANCAAFLACLNSMPFDLVARQKVGGVNFSFYFMKQLPGLAPSCYTPGALNFIVPRVLELTFTAHDIKPWAEDLAAYDPRPAAERGQPFAWNPERRAQLRAELDAYYARLYGLTRDELCYILDPKDVMGEDYPSETFRVLREGELRQFGEYRTRRLVLEAWDRLAAASA